MCATKITKNSRFRLNLKKEQQKLPQIKGKILCHGYNFKDNLNKNMAKLVNFGWRNWLLFENIREINSITQDKEVLVKSRTQFTENASQKEADIARRRGMRFLSRCSRSIMNPIENGGTSIQCNSCQKPFLGRILITFGFKGSQNKKSRLGLQTNC